MDDSHLDDATVVVTGIGVLTGDVTGAQGMWARLIERPPRPTHRRIVGFDARDWMDRRQAQRTDRFSQVAVAAALLAHDDAGSPSIDAERTGVVLGSGAGGSITQREETINFLREGSDGISHLYGVKGMSNANAANVALTLGTKGPCFTVGSGCVSGTHAVAEGARLIKDGIADVVYAGGSEAALTEDDPDREAVTAALLNMRVHSTTGIGRAFDLNRGGFVYAEGSAVMRLETLASARQRGGRVYAALLGGGNTTDGYDLIAPEPRGDGLRRSMAMALAHSRLEREDVLLINAHGTGTHVNDLAEACAIHDLFGDKGPAVNTFKPVLGHSGAASGALEAAGIALSLYHRIIPATAWLDDPDPEITEMIDVVHSSHRTIGSGAALSNSLGLGGMNGSVLMATVL